MRLLLDTHTLIWWDLGKLPARTVRIVKDAADVFVSAATAWEIAIKESLGKIRMGAKVSDVARAYGFRELPIAFSHAEHVRTLPAIHRDPFDRLLIAQGAVEGLAIVTRDPVFVRYGAVVAWR